MSSGDMAPSALAAEDSRAPAISIVICTLGKPTLGRVLDRLAQQTANASSFEVIVVADALAGHAADAGARACQGRPYAARVVQAQRPGASAARNAGIRAAAAALLLFIGDDNLPEPQLVAEHLAWHRREPAQEVGVLGHVRWADNMRVTPFMRWLEHGVQFDYPNIDGTDAGWARFYTANVSVKRRIVELVGGFDEERLPFLYEDLDLALRMHEHGFRLLYNRRAVAEHLHPTNLADWRSRAAAIAVAERRFVDKHPDFEPYFHRMFAGVTQRPAQRPIAATLTWLVGRKAPLIGPRAWARADLYYRQQLAGPFLRAWEDDQASASTEGALSPAGSPPAGPK